MAGGRRDQEIMENEKTREDPSSNKVWFELKEEG